MMDWKTILSFAVSKKGVIILKLRYVRSEDKEFVMSIDLHVNEVNYNYRVYTKSGYIMWKNNEPIGLMHHSVLWDNLPFLNFIYVKETFRSQGIANEMMRQWESDMKTKGYKMVLISTQVDESAQHLYRKLGYIDCGGLLMNNTPFEQPMEMFMRKVL